MNLTRFRRVMTPISISMVILSVTLTVLSTIQKEPMSTLAIVIAITCSAFVLSVSFFILVSARRPLAQQYAIAFLGLPRSGKTTLITSIFGEIFAGKLPLRMAPKGQSTIKRINENLELLQSGRALGPTKDQDRFAFRADLEVQGLLYPRIYKLEFGDFSGEESDKFAVQNELWLHETEFFKWVADSDAMVFVVDIGEYLSPSRGKDYVGRVNSRFRAAWQHFVDINSYRINQVRQHPVVLVFNKADLLGIAERQKAINLLEQEISRLGFGYTVPKLAEIDPIELSRGHDLLLSEFKELIKYFKREIPNFSVILTSSFGTQDGKRLGISDLVKDVFPKKSIAGRI